MSDLALSSAGASSKGAVASLSRSLAMRFAFRELRGGLSGFYVLIACIALGVAAIAGVNSVSRGMTQSIQSEGQVILGGDLELSRVHTRANDAERGFFQERARVSEIASLRAILRRTEAEDGGEFKQTIVDLKAVDGLYPLYGAFDIVGGGDLHPRLAPEDGVYGLIVAQEIGAQLGVDIGDRVELGRAQFDIRGFTETEPDGLAMGIAIGPRVVLSLAGLAATELVQPGSLMRWHYRLRINPDAMASDADLERLIADIETAFPQAGWRVTSRANAAPGLSDSIGRFAQFLTLVGLTALIAGGVGVANAVSSFVDSKRTVIATFKCLGASGSFVFWVYLIQVIVIALIGIVIGLVFGALAPLLAASFLSDLLPVEGMRRVFPLELVLAVFYGLLTALAFAVWPLGRAHDVHPTAVFRDKAAAMKGLPRKQYLLGTGVILLALAGLAIGLAGDQRLAGVFLLAVAGMLLLLRLVAVGIAWIAKQMPHVRRTEVRLAISNIHRPGALTPSVVLSLGLGLAVLVSLTLIDVNIRNQLTGNIPEQAPSFFFIDVQKSEADAFKETLKVTAPEAVLNEAPMLRGRIISMAGTKSEDFDQENDEAWVLRGDRGITFSQMPPENGKIMEGEWWPADTTEALVSMDKDVTDAFGLDIGDEIVVNVLGRDVSARIANTRTIEWQSLSINFVMIFSPPTFAGAPHPSLITLTYPKEVDGVRMSEQDLIDSELTLLKEVSLAFPTVTSIRVKDALDAVNAFVSDLALAVRAAAAVTLIASIFVLAGALAAGQRQRIHDAIILKTLGATRPRIIATFLSEYAILGVATALFALLAGGLAAYLILEQIMQISFYLDVGVVAVTLSIALGLTVTFGMVGTWRVLGQKPATVLRNL